jgi:hypothetical protein
LNPPHPAEFFRSLLDETTDPRVAFEAIRFGRNLQIDIESGELYRQYQLLRSMPGIGEVSAIQLLAELV